MITLLTLKPTEKKKKTKQESVKSDFSRLRHDNDTDRKESQRTVSVHKPKLLKRNESRSGGIESNQGPSSVLTSLTPLPYESDKPNRLTTEKCQKEGNVLYIYIQTKHPPPKSVEEARLTTRSDVSPAMSCQQSVSGVGRATCHWKPTRNALVLRSFCARNYTCSPAGGPWLYARLSLLDCSFTLFCGGAAKAMTSEAPINRRPRASTDRRTQVSFLRLAL